jgi:threonine dehydrogenase-like Zn-dependent dehydrogenase
MLALVVDPALKLRKDYLDPAAASGESIVQVALAGICGTDLEITRGYMAYRGIPGHEFVGRVVESGDPKLKGKRVVGEINAACRHCSFCRIDLARHCLDRTVLGILGRDGAFAEYLRLPDENLLVVPDTIPDEAAVFTEPLAAAFEIFEQIHLAHDRTIAILGDGRLGAMTALALKSRDYQPVLAGHHPEKLERLASLGLMTAEERALSEKFDYVVDCTGTVNGLNRAIELVKARGTIVLKSTTHAGTPLNLSSVVVNELTIVGSRCGRFTPALEALAAGTIDPRPLIDGVYSLSEGPAAIAAAGKRGNFKILLKP